MAEPSLNTYSSFIKEAGIAQNSVVRGCMVIQPWGIEMWNNVKKTLGFFLSLTKHTNYRFPTLIPVKLFGREEKHSGSFSKECAVVTHSKIKVMGAGVIVPKSKLKDLYVLRPTSESIVGFYFSKWINSYRELPLLINQWVSVFRWEMKTRLFLRNVEFLWQEGHTAHSSRRNACLHIRKIARIYKLLFKKYLAVSFFFGKKTMSEKFPNALTTYSLEGSSKNCKFIQLATIHFFGRNVSKVYDIKFLNSKQRLSFVWTTSWGISTRVIGGLIKIHRYGDLVNLPPKIIPINVVLVSSLYSKDVRLSFLIRSFCLRIVDTIRKSRLPIKVFLDKKGSFVKWYSKGVPLILKVTKGAFLNNKVQVFNNTECRKCLKRPDKSLPQYLYKKLEYLNYLILSKSRSFNKLKTLFIRNKVQFFILLANMKVRECVPCLYVKESFVTENILKKKFGLTTRCMLVTEYKLRCIFTNKKNSCKSILAKSY